MDSRKVRVKNRAPAPIQITAEQILLEAQERVGGASEYIPTHEITDQDELDEYRMSKRKGYEDGLRSQRVHMPNWLRYARWEESQKEYTRARSVYERALDVNYKHVPLWLKYAEMEMKAKFINRARNVWDRAVTLLPRIDQLWYKYVFMEEMVGNVAGARLVLDRWMEWEPEPHCWATYVKFEVRHGDMDRARNVWERYIGCHPLQTTYIRYAKWEERQAQSVLARKVYERAIEELADDEKDEELYIQFARFEQRCGETDRARVIFKYGIDKLPRQLCEELYKEYTSFEKQHGDRKGIEDVIIGKRRFQYTEMLKAKPMDYDTWFDYARLEEENGTAEQVRAVYSRAVNQLPPVNEKRFWRRYVYLWINWALYEELEAGDVAAAREVYRSALQTIPHKVFTFAKLWLLAAHFEVRQRDLVAARKLLGTAIGMCPKEKLFKGYIELELQLCNVDRCRRLYQSYLKTMPHNCGAWIKYAELEVSVGEDERARGVYSLAVQQPVLDTPEVLWKAFIEFEAELEETARVRELYERLLDRTKHAKVWLSFAQFEAGIKEHAAARAIYERAYNHFRASNTQEERVLMLEAWHKFELALNAEMDNEEALEKVRSKLPRKIKKRRKITTEDGGDAGWEEYYDYVFPDDDRGQSNMKLLQMAQMWAKKRAEPDS